MLSRAHVRIHWFAFSSRHLDHLAVDSELVGCAGWNSGFLVSITWFNPFYCKKKKQFGERYDIFHLKPVFLELFKPRGNGFSPSRNTPPKKSFSIFSKSLSLLKISLDWKVLISLQTSSKTFKRHTGSCKDHGRGVQDTTRARRYRLEKLGPLWRRTTSFSHGYMVDNISRKRILHFVASKWTFSVFGVCWKFWNETG